MYLSKTTIFIITVSLLILFLWKCENENPGQIGTVDTTRWTNKAGKEVVSLRGNEQAFGTRDKKIADSLAKVYSTRISKMKEYIIFLEHAQADLKPIDSSKAADYFPPVGACPPQVKNFRQSFSNSWYKADVQIGGSSYMHLDRRDTVTAMWTKGKNWLQLNLSSADTTNHIYGVKAYRQYLPKKKWSIGVQVGYGVTIEKPLNPVPFIGFGITYSLIKF
jgi:hypothetical protein